MNQYKFNATVTVYAETKTEAVKLVTDARVAINKGDNLRLYTYELEAVKKA